MGCCATGPQSRERTSSETILAGEHPMACERDGPMLAQVRTAICAQQAVATVHLSQINDMIQNIKQLYGVKLEASDGAIGCVKDFYFDDKTCGVRYLVVNTGAWLSGHQLLLPLHAFVGSGANDNVMRVNLTRKQIENSPLLGAGRSISVQYEEAFYHYYGWPAHREGGQMWKMAQAWPFRPSLASAPPLQQGQEHDQRGDQYLRRTRAIIGYHIQTANEAIGRVSGLRLDDRTWLIHEFVVETGRWYSGKKIMLLPRNIERFSYENSSVFVNLSTEDIQQTKKNDVARSVAVLPRKLALAG